MVPHQIGRYRVQGLLGKGGMGEVYRAFDPDLDREVVLKIITLPSPDQNNEWRQRFKREVQAAARLNHPHIVTVYDVGLEHEPPYVVMELLTGGTLRQRLKRSSIPWPETLTMLRPLGQALAYAHRAGVIHRDVKPGNIMFAGAETPPPAQARPESGRGGGARGVLKLVDFGLARQQDGKQLTHTGAVFGTPGYMSPEQAHGEVVDGRTDIFALGIILFEAITGHNPLDKGSVISTLTTTAAKTPIDLSPLTGKAPPEVIRLIEQAVAKKREQRYPTGEALLTDLDRCLGESPDDLNISMTQISTRPPPSSDLSPGGPLIQKSPNVDLTPEVEIVLQTMFSEFSRLAIEAEFGHGLSGGRVLRVRPVEAGGRAQLPVVIKIAPIDLIRQEWQAYQNWVANILPGVARLESPPTLPPGSLWDGLRYTLVGEGAFEVQSLHSYYQQASIEDLQWVLAEQLYPIIGVHWWLDRRLDRAFQMQTDYDSILPVNLRLKPTAAIPTGTNVHPITPQQVPTIPPKKGEIVHLEGFVVTEVDPNQHLVTLNLPPTSPVRPSPAYRLRLVEVPDLDRYRVGRIVDSLTGLVTAARHDLLVAEASRALGETIDLSVEQLTLPNSSALSGKGRPGKRFWPNPLLAYQDRLYDLLTVNISTIHGDLNLENILVDPETGHVNLIDFATVRQGHSLHDLLRLETEVVTKLVSAALAQGKLPPETIYPFYEQLHRVTLYPDQFTTPQLPHPDLEKPFAMLTTIRKLAGRCLFDSDDWTEYYQGLILYLLGALKFKNLDELPSAPLPKQVAFWGAATLVDLLDNPPPPPKPKSREWPAWVMMGGAIAIIILGLAVALLGLSAGGFISLPGFDSPAQGELMATIINVNPEVKVERAGTERLVNASFGADLYGGDVLYTRPGASVDIACTNGLILHLPEQRNMIVDCREDTTAAQVIGQLEPDLSDQLVRASEPISGVLASTERSSRLDQAQVPLLLSPRNSLIADQRPTFRWQPVERASSYRLSLTLPDGEVWSEETGETTLPYPIEAPPLEPGSANIVELATLGDETGQAVDKTLLQVLDKAGLANLAEAEATIQTLELNETAQRYLLAQLYQQHEMWAAAIDQLEQSAEAEDIPSAELWQQLGDLYFRVGLYLLAEDSYNHALTFAKVNEDLSVQAAAQIGLGRTALTFDEIAAAIEHLDTAEVLYRKAGQIDLAEAVAADRKKLME
jgi:serine/threonine protein kinase